MDRVEVVRLSGRPARLIRSIGPSITRGYEVSIKNGPAPPQKRLRVSGVVSATVDRTEDLRYTAENWNQSRRPLRIHPLAGTSKEVISDHAPSLAPFAVGRDQTTGRIEADTRLVLMAVAAFSQFVRGVLDT